MNIYKYPFPINSRFLRLPSGAKILDIQVQHGEVVAWALVDPSSKKDDIGAIQLDTGDDTSAFKALGASYFKTFQLHDGHTVRHIFVFDNFLQTGSV